MRRSWEERWTAVSTASSHQWFRGVWLQASLQMGWQNAAWWLWALSLQHKLLRCTRPQTASLRPRCAARTAPPANNLGTTAYVDVALSVLSALPSLPGSAAADDLQRRHAFHVIQPPQRNKSSKWLRNLLSIPSSRTLSRIWTHLTAVVATGSLSRSVEGARARAREDVH